MMMMMMMMMMMDKPNIQKISNTIKLTGPDKFVSYVESYIQRADQRDMLLIKPPVEDKKPDDVNHTTMEQASKPFLANISLLLKSIAGLQFKTNGQPKKAQTTEIRGYFRSIKQHQIELLMCISDEVQMICNMIQQAQTVRKVFQSHVEPIYRSEFFMDVIRERFSQHSVPVLDKEYVETQEIKQITGTFENIKEYDETWKAGLDQDSNSRPLEKALQDYYDLTRHSHKDIENRKNKILAEMKEFKQGWQVFKKLVIEGYSPKLGRELEPLLARHALRIEEFQNDIQAGRLELNNHSAM